MVLAGLAIFVAYPWWSYRQTHSITEDAFVEAHIINVAPQTVSGHIVRFLVEENDRVKKGDVQCKSTRKLTRFKSLGNLPATSSRTCC
jgi:membrane fusion protein, multidrug efflux system